MPWHKIFNDSKQKMLRLTLLTNPDRCNLRCPLCFLHQRGYPFGMGEMPFEVVRRSVEKAMVKGLYEVIPSTMGEPLLYTYFSELVELCGACNIPINLTTNGSFPGGWKTDEGMLRLIESCSDIKVSCMGWGESFSEMVIGISFEEWKKNVERLMMLRTSVEGKCLRVSSISLQVTLHQKNYKTATEILQWAEFIGISRIKWNLPIFLSVAPDELFKRYALLKSEVEHLRENLVSDKVKCEGSLFFENESARDTADCPFVRELWVLPDGSEQRCPNPERRYGDKESELAKCTKCPMK